ncbi:MAG: FAD-binding protein [Actinomyces sp.]|nr:FAD-binding protein [Actinomyces sp.]
MSEQGKNRPSINAEEHRRPRARTHAPRLSDMTTFRVGGPVATLVEPSTEDAFIDAVRRADDEHSPDRLLILGGGSNILADDAPFDGTVIRDARASLETDVTWTPSEPSAPQSSPVIVTAASGVAWDALVNESVKRGLSGLEALSGIPGTVGAAPVQNIGAYGGEVAHTLLHIGAWDRLEQRRVELTHDDLELGYRSSILKQSRLTPRMDGSQWGPTGRWVVLDVTLQLTHSHMSAPVAYSQLARALDVPIGQQVETNRVRSEVLRLADLAGLAKSADGH